uniref:W2 domain-containing protein n=1 Tax=Glossina brevipalpis TaxID=37001 RepID=A0A1A9WGD2_9MUSC
MMRKIRGSAFVIDNEAKVADDEDEKNHFTSPKMKKLIAIIENSDYNAATASNPEYLILEINSSRYAYNMSLREVKFNIVKTILNMSPIKRPPNNISVALNTVFNHLRPIMANYIRTDDAMVDCLKALENVHYLYDQDFVTEDIILAWYKRHDNNQDRILKQSLQNFIKWLQQTSDGDDKEMDKDV